MVQPQALTSCFSHCVRNFVLAMVTIAIPFHTALAQDTPPALGTAQSFAVLAGSAATNTGPTIVTGDLGVSPGTAITGFPPGTVVGGAIHAADAVASQAQSDSGAAYVNLAGQACNEVLTGQDLGGLTLTAGVYCFTSSAQLTGTLTLDAQGNSAAVWIFQIGSTLTTASNSSVLVINGGHQCNVFWQIGSSATLGTGTVFAGNILALTSITLTTGVNLSGRALAQNGAVTMDSNVVSISGCATAGGTIPPTLGKSFSPGSITAGGVSTLTITLSNPDSTVATLSSSLVDTLPAGLTISGSAVTTCTDGAVNAVPGGSSVTLTAGSIPAGGSCTVTVPVTASAGGNYINSLAIGALETSNGNNAAPAVSTLTVTALSVPPSLSKSFSPNSISSGGTSTLTITLNNSDPAIATLSSPLVDALPGDVTVSGSGSTTCSGGTVTASVGGSTVTLTGGSIPASGSCTITIPVTASIAGNDINTLSVGALVTNNGNNLAPAVATLTVNSPVNAPPTLGKAFSPATILAGGGSTLIITLINPSNAVAILSTPLTDNLPNGLTTSGGGQTTCGGVVTITSTAVTLTGGSIPASGSCTVTVPTTALLGGNYINSLTAGALQTSNGANSAPAIATLTVNAAMIPPSLGKTFSPSTITAGGTSIITITLSNANTTAATLLSPLVDTLPGGVTVKSSGSTTCTGTLSAVQGSSTITLTGGTIPAQSSCTVTVPVSASADGSYFNSIPAGALSTSNGKSAAPAIATLTVNAPLHVAPTLSKAFNPSTIYRGGVTTLTITLSNANSTAANLTSALTDNLPSNMTIASGTVSTTCGGTVTAIKGSSKVTLTGGSIPALGSCKVTVPVTASTENCECMNVLPIGDLQTSNGSNSAPASARLTVIVPPVTTPTLRKGYGPTAIKPGGTALLTITLTNATSTVDKLTSPFTDTFPSGEFVAGAAANTCGGTTTAHVGDSSVTLSGGSIPANGSCTISVKVTAKANGNYYNMLPVCSLRTDKGCNAGPYVAILTVGIRLVKSFGPSSIALGGTSILTISLNNPSSTIARMTAPLIDAMPKGLVVSGSATSTCGGVVTAINGSSTVTLTGGAIPAGGSCSVKVKVTAANPGCYYNRLPTGALQTNQGNSLAPYTASLTVN